MEPRPVEVLHGGPLVAGVVPGRPTGARRHDGRWRGLVTFITGPGEQYLRLGVRGRGPAAGMTRRCCDGAVAGPGPVGEAQHGQEQRYLWQGATS